MEPCAPGTEDDPPIMYSTLTKKEEEQKRLLSQKAFLKSGKYENIFELKFQNGIEHWYCYACECPVMGRAFQHELGRKHIKNISNTHHNVENLQKSSSSDKQSVQLEVAPGEPVPPGFEEVGRVSQIQERLDGFKVGPLVALEYLIELQDDDPSKEPFYVCILCDKKGDPRTVLTHLASYNHISQYLQKHFPTCWRVLAPYNTKQYRRNWQTTLQKIAEGIEKKFGRLKPFPIDKDKFNKDRLHYVQIVGKGLHFTENTGYTFEELVIHDELTKTLEAVDDKPYESSTTNNWGTSAFIQKPFKKRSPSPPVVGIPSKRNRGNAQTNPRKQEPAFIAQTRETSKPQDAPLNKLGEEENPKQKQYELDSSDKPPVRRRSLSSVSSISDKSDKSDDNRHKLERNRVDRNKHQFQRRGNRFQFDRERQLPYGRRRSPTPRRRSISPRRRSPVRRRSPFRRRSPSPSLTQVSRRSQSPTYKAEQEKEKLRKIEEFKKLGRAIESDMLKTLKLHEKNPEKHPQYNDEWKKFWNKRYKELKTQGVDVSKHDFKPEWIEFWNKRMVEIHSDELRNRKEALRKRLALPEDINPIKFKIGSGAINVLSGKASPKPLPMAAQPDQDNEIIIIDDKDDERDKKRQNSPWEDRGSSKQKSRRSSSPRSKRSRERSPFRRARSPQRFPKRSRSRDRVTSKNRSRSRDRMLGTNEKGRIKHVSPIGESLQTSRIKDSTRGRDFKKSRSRSRNRSLSRNSTNRSTSRERSFDRKRMVRESSFERDLRGKERIRTVADLPWEREITPVYRNPYLPPPVMREATRQPVDVMSKSDDEGEVNVVDVLRILTALEDRLGSLGPKVIDLLAQALALEKNEANSSEQLLDNEINCVLFETIKEKLKGQMFAGLVDHKQQRAFKKAIQKIASLLHLSESRMRQREKLQKPSLAAGSGGVVDKAAIAKQIANALIAQGKTDVTQAELEQLINAVVGMAEASKVSSKPMTTAGFLQMLGSGTAIDKNEDFSTKKSGPIDIEKLTEPLTPSPGKNSTNNMENLSDSDLQMLLQNFKDLSTEEQHNLINYLKKLEYQEPDRVEKLRKFVNLESSAKSKEDLKGTSNVNFKEDEEENKLNPKRKSHGRDSPFSNRLGGVNPVNDDLVNIESEEENDSKDDDNDNDQNKEVENKPDKKVNVDSEDEYTFEDVVKTVSKNVKDKEMENSKKVLEETIKYEKSKSNLNNAKDLISELMSNITKHNSSNSNSSSSNSNTLDLLGLSKSVTPNPPNVANVDLTKLLNINVASLASIVNNVKNMTSKEVIDQKLGFKPPSPVRNQHKLNFDLGPLKPEPSKLGNEELIRGSVDRDYLGPRSFDKGIGGPGPNTPFPGGQQRYDGPDYDRERREFALASDRFGPGFNAGSDRFAQNDFDRFGPGGADRFGSERFVPAGPDRFGPGGFDRFEQKGTDRFNSDRFGTGGPDRFESAPDRLGLTNLDRLGLRSQDRLGFGGPIGSGPGLMAPSATDRLGPGGVHSGQDRGFGGIDKERPQVGPDMSRQILGSIGGQGINGQRMGGVNTPRGSGQGGIGGYGKGGQIRPNILMENKGLTISGSRLGTQFGGPRSNLNDQRNFQRLPAPDFSRQGNTFNRW